MIRIFEFDALKPEEILNRDIRAEASVEATVDAIIADVRARGDAALKDYALKFDHAQLDELRVSQAEIDEAFEAAGEDFVTTLKMAAANIRAFHEHQVHKNFVMNDTPGIVLGQKAHQCAVALPVGGDHLGTGNATLLSGVQLELCRVAEVLEHLTIFIRNCDLHTKNSFLCTRFSIPILTDCGEIGKGTRGFCVFWGGKHSRYVKMISETDAKCIIIEPEKRVQV